MNRRNIISLSAITALGLTMLPGIVVAQQKTLKEQLVGTWILVSSTSTTKDGRKLETWGPDPKGTYMFDAGGRFAQLLMRSDLPKTASRDKGAPDTDRAIVAGSISQYGTYSVDETAKVINVRFEGSSFAAFNGTNGKRIINALTADELKLTNPATSDGGVVETTWRRAK
jgi:hypothetical protein